MIKATYSASTWLILLLGAAHTGIGFYCRHMSASTLWFIGSGMAIIFAGLFNLLLILSPTKTVAVVTVIMNAAVFGLFLLAAQVISGMQVYAGLALFFIAESLALAGRKQYRSHQLKTGT